MKLLVFAVLLTAAVVIAAAVVFYPLPRWDTRDVWGVKLLLLLIVILLAVNAGLTLYTHFHAPKPEIIILRALSILWAAGLPLLYMLAGVPALKQVGAQAIPEDPAPGAGANGVQFVASFFRNDPPTMILWIWISLVGSTLALVLMYSCVRAIRKAHERSRTAIGRS